MDAPARKAQIGSRKEPIMFSPSSAPELFWLAASALLTAVLWVPYIVNRMAEHGLWPALQNARTTTCARRPPGPTA